MKKISCVVLATLALSACSTRYSSIGEDQYLQSRNGVNLDVPPPLTRDNISHFYDLPSQNTDARAS
ncbi:MAG: hypothetical protein ACHP6H_06970, partial [Legionellales bacterium]